MTAWKGTLGALLSPFFPKRSGGCAPEAFVVAKQPSAALSVTRRCGALAAFWKVEMFLSRCGADAPGKNQCVACLGEKHGLRSRALAVSTAMCFPCGRSDPAWRSFARTLRLAFPRALVPLLPRHSEGCGPGVRNGIGQRRRALPFLCLHLTDSVPHFRVGKHALRVLPVRYCGQASLHFEKHSHSSRHVIFLCAHILCAAVIVCKN